MGTSEHTLKEIFTDQQIRDLKRLGHEEILSLVSTDSLIFIDMEDLKDLFKDSKIVACGYLNVEDLNEKKAIDFDKGLIIINSNRIMKLEEMVTIVSSIKNYSFGETDIISAAMCSDEYPFDVLYILSKKIYSKDEDLIVNSSYKCAFCGFHPIRHNHFVCPYCEKDTYLSEQIGKYFLRSLRDIDSSKSDLKIIDELRHNDDFKTKVENIIKSLLLCGEIIELDSDSCDLSMDEENKKYYNRIMKDYDKYFDFYYNEYTNYYSLSETPKYIKKIEVIDLFGYHSYELNFENKSNISIIFGTNGLGKTTIFKMLNYLLISKEYDDLFEFPEESKFSHSRMEYYDHVLSFFFKVPLTSFSVTFFDDSQIKISKNNDKLYFDYEYAHHTRYFDNVCAGIIIDKNDSEKYNEMAKHYFCVNSVLPQVNNYNRFLFVKVNRAYDAFEIQSQLKEYYKEHNTDFSFNLRAIKALEILNAPDFVTNFKSMCKSHIHEIKKIIKIKKNKIVFSEQSAANSFAYLKNIDFIKDMLKDVNYIIDINSKHGSAIKLFESSVKILCDIAKEYLLFKHTFESFYYEYDPANKKVAFDYENMELYLKAKEDLYDKDYNVRLNFENLSSGEVNLANILFNIIFNTDCDSIVLIDEPEISLHIEWQQQFADVISELIKEKTNMQVIIASHSPFIASGNEELIVAPKLLIDDKYFD